MKFRVPATGLAIAMVVISMTVTDVAAAPSPKTPKTFAFSSVTYQATEGSSATIYVTRSVSHGPASVTLTSSDGTAVAGTNYEAVSTTVAFKSRQSEVGVPLSTFNVGILPNEGVTVTLTLSAPSRRWSLGSPVTATLTIYDVPVPSVPLDLAASVVTGLSVPYVQLTWTAPTSGGVDHYAIGSSTTSGGPYSAIGTTTDTSFEVTPVPTVTTYYAVEAFNVNDIGSGYSGEVAVEPPVIGSGLYWANFSNGTIMAANLDGTGVTTLVTGQNEPAGVAVDAAHLYWVDEGSGDVMSANLDGTGVTTLVSGQNHPIGVAVDASHIYWVNHSDGTVNEADLDVTTDPVSVTNVTTLVDGESEPTAIAVGNGFVYWTSGATDEIREYDLSGGGSATTLVTTTDYPFAIAVDANYVYWAVTGSNSGSDGAILDLRVDGTGGVNTVASSQAHPDGIAVSTSSLYWANATSNSIVGATLGSSGSVTSVSTLVTGQAMPLGVAVASS